MGDPADSPRYFDRRRGPLFVALLKGLALTLAASVLFASLFLAHSPWPWEPLPFFGMTLIVVSAFVLTRFHLKHSPLGGVPTGKAEQMIGLVALLAVAGIQLMISSLGRQPLVGVGFLLVAPLVAQAMLISALLGPPTSLFALTVVTFGLGIAGAVQVEMLATAWLAGAVGAHAVVPLHHRSDILRATSVVSLALCVIAACVSAIQADHWLAVAESAGWAALAGIGATSLFWLAVAILERIFGIVSNWSLLELCSPEHPLLRELTLHAPGTYVHSVLVANLAEAAARAVGANPILCRAMAYFHDVGKLNRPAYFVENQTGENVHDEMDPELSAKIIRQHVPDGLELAKQYRLPKVIADAIAQHHGTSLITYFFEKARRQSPPDRPPLESEFRYPGPKPRSKENAILFLADSVEAASRTLRRASSEQLEVMVARIIEEKRADGQLDESELTFHDLRLVQASFLHSLSALRHERIPYPEVARRDRSPTPRAHLEGMEEPSPSPTYPDGA